VVMWRACRIARTAGDLYSTVVAAGVVSWFGFQGFENIGMTLGIMPVAGIPLPFVSYGGSSMFAIWVGIGLLQSVKMQRSMAAG
jgi:rod shape determining protein RodA